MCIVCVQPEACRNESSGPGMYVIFPAEELIYMTYGAAVPRFKQRPTLDNLREPVVLLQTVPNQTSSHRPNSSSNQSTASFPNNNQQSNSNKINKPFTDIFGYSSTAGSDSREPSIYSDECEEEIDGYNLIDNQQSISCPNPSAASVTFNAKQQQQQQQTSNLDKKGRTATTKPKSRLGISLGRLGRSKRNQPTEPARLRDITEIKIANPTFTRENLSARNYDAFFESGEPVYSLEYRTPLTPQTESNPFDQIDETTKRPHSFGIFTKMSKSASATAPTTSKMNARSRSSDPMSTVFEKGDRCHSLNTFYYVFLFTANNK